MNSFRTFLDNMISCLTCWWREYHNPNNEEFFRIQKLLTLKIAGVKTKFDKTQALDFNSELSIEVKKYK